jgi:ParB family transcriptional regulator, chromosome partitioning protein
VQRKVLGRGLDALIAGNDGASTTAEPSGGVLELPVSEVGPNPHQPRIRFDDDAIKELAASIKASGVLQPIIVRRDPAGGYQLVAGERRLRAATFIGLERIPAIVRDVPDSHMLEYALIENIQRENLNPIEEAKAYHGLTETVGLTHDQISERVGKQRTSITNAIRLLSLPVEVQDMVSRGTLSAGHARALLGLESPGEMLGAAKYVSSKGFSVRRTESFIRRRQRKHTSRPAKAKLGGLEEWETKLQQKFGTHVSISSKRKGGAVQFEFYGQEDLERLLEAWGVL